MRPHRAGHRKAMGTQCSFSKTVTAVIVVSAVIAAVSYHAAALSAINSLIEEGERCAV